MLRIVADYVRVLLAIAGDNPAAHRPAVCPAAVEEGACVRPEYCCCCRATRKTNVAPGNRNLVAFRVHALRERVVVALLRRSGTGARRIRADHRAAGKTHAGADRRALRARRAALRRQCRSRCRPPRSSPRRLSSLLPPSGRRSSCRRSRGSPGHRRGTGRTFFRFREARGFRGRWAQEWRTLRGSSAPSAAAFFISSGESRAELPPAVVPRVAAAARCAPALVPGPRGAPSIAWSRCSPRPGR